VVKRLSVNEAHEMGHEAVSHIKTLEGALMMITCFSKTVPDGHQL
jgi:hypothetical protein